MKVTYNWLKDFVDIKLKPQVLADKLTMAGIEVKSVEPKEGDFIFEIEITSNRPDWLSVIGIAREIAAITNSRIKIPQSNAKIQSAKESIPLKIKIEHKKDCPLYTAKIIKDIKVGPSPDWLKKCLELIGARSINNLVDITNYILFTYGQPLHAFDLDKLCRAAGNPGAKELEIAIRRAKQKEEIITLDGVKRILSEDTLIIAFGNRELNTHPVAIAGIMGGKDTEVNASTKNILLEAAIFNPLVIRRARQKLGIQTDSSYRFERGVALETAPTASLEAARLITQACVGVYVLAKSSSNVKSKKITLDLRIPSVAKVLGLDIKPARVKEILSGLGFEVKTTKDKLKVKVPAFRQDVKKEIDLIEEVARIFGFENIPQTLPAFYPNLTSFKPRVFLPEIKNMLIGLGLNEAITYSLIDKGMLRGFGQDEGSLIEILNPLSQEQEILRPFLAPSLIKAVALNLNQKQEEISIFEIANSYSWVNALPKEELRLGIVLCGMRNLLLGEASIKDELGLLHLKGILEAFFYRLGIKDYGFIKDSVAQFNINLGQEKIGVMRILEKNILNSFSIDHKKVVVAEVSLDKLLGKADLNKKFQGLPVYPGISRDISIIIDEHTAVDGVLALIKEKAGKLLQQAKITDYYKGKQIPAGFRGLTISCLYRSNQRTLTEEEINPLHSACCSALAQGLGAKLR